MDFRQLQYILQVAKDRSFSKAAKNLYIAQPSLSQYILKAEQQLGNSLFDRTVKPLRLTYAGELYIDKAKRILDLKAQLVQQMEDIADLKQGRVKIGLSRFRSTYILPTLFPVFSKMFPGISVSLVEGTTAELEDFTTRGITDFSIITLPNSKDLFIYEPILTEEILIAIPPEHPISRRARVTSDEQILRPSIRLAELREESFIMLTPGQGMRQVALSLCRQAGIKPRIVLETKSIEAAHSLVAAGVGVTFIPDTLVWFGKMPESPVYFSIEEDPPPTRTIVVAYRKEAYLSKAARAFIAVTKDVLGQCKDKQDRA